MPMNTPLPSQEYFPVTIISIRPFWVFQPPLVSTRPSPLESSLGIGRRTLSPRVAIWRKVPCPVLPCLLLRQSNEFSLCLPWIKYTCGFCIHLLNILGLILNLYFILLILLCYEFYRFISSMKWASLILIYHVLLCITGSFHLIKVQKIPNH